MQLNFNIAVGGPSRARFYRLDTIRLFTCPGKNLQSQTRRKSQNGFSLRITTVLSHCRAEVTSRREKMKKSLCKYQSISGLPSNRLANFSRIILFPCIGQKFILYSVTELSQKYQNWSDKRQHFFMLLRYLSLFFTRKGTKRSALSVGVGKR